ncbi:MAG: DUF502 domain-containing protein [Rhabdochlamydiaceae bacterium]|jgi:uncharacterized membrane protein
MSLLKNLKNYFMTGLAILLPVVITILTLQFIVNFLTEPFVGMITPLLKHFHIDHYGTAYFPPDKLLLYSSKACILVLLFIFTIFIGIVTRWFLVRMTLNLWDRILNKIPVIKTIYKTTQDIIKTLFSPDEHSFQQVVLVPFPKEHIYALALISSTSPASCSQKVGAKLISVLIPTTPNPTAGFLLMYKEEDLIYIDMKPEEAIKYIVSCGMIAPDLKAKVGK